MIQLVRRWNKITPTRRHHVVRFAIHGGAFHGHPDREDAGLEIRSAPSEEQPDIAHAGLLDLGKPTVALVGPLWSGGWIEVDQQNRRDTYADYNPRLGTTRVLELN